MKLLPCVFCGSDKLELVELYNGISLIHCSECKTYGPRKNTERKAVNAWNKAGERVAKLQEQVDKLEDLFVEG